jgi:hypothetical protein
MGGRKITFTDLNRRAKLQMTQAVCGNVSSRRLGGVPPREAPFRNGLAAAAERPSLVGRARDRWVSIDREATFRRGKDGPRAIVPLRGGLWRDLASHYEEHLGTPAR